MNRLAEVLTHLLPFLVISGPGPEDDEVGQQRAVMLAPWAIGLIVAFVAGLLGIALQAGVVISSLSTIDTQLARIETSVQAERSDQRDLATRVARLSQRVADSMSGAISPHAGAP